MDARHSRFARWLLGLALPFGLMAPLLGHSASAEDLGLELATEARDSKRGFGNFTASQEMVLRNKQGRESRRQIRVQVLEVADDGDKSMFLFDEPRDVKGTAFLIHGHKASDDDQWLYLPALRRVKRISSANRSGSFMGSEFAYEDMSAQEVEKYTYRYLRDEPCAQAAGANVPLAEGLACAVYERFPTDAKSGYSRQEVWQDRDAARLWKVAYYDRKGDHLKTLTFGSYQQYLDQFWHAHEMEMVNHLTGKGTVLSWSDYQFRTDLDDGDFTQTGLRRIR